MNRKMRVGVVWLALLIGAASTIAIGSAGVSSSLVRSGAVRRGLRRSPRQRARGTKRSARSRSSRPSDLMLRSESSTSLPHSRSGTSLTECLTVHFVTNSYVGNELVSSGAGTITGEGSAADTMVDVANGSNFVGISTFGDTSDYAISTRKSITSLTQLEGKVLGYHAPIPVALDRDAKGRPRRHRQGRRGERHLV